MNDHDMMTMEQARARIRELAAERDAAIDARLNIERERDALELNHTETEVERDDARKDAARLRAELDAAAAALDRVPCAIGDTLPSRVRWLVGQNRQLATAVAATDGDAFVLQRAAWHLANGCDTPERARAEARRELAVVLGASC